jgi:hypothetical protein
MSETVLTTGHNDTSDPLHFFDAYYNLNKPYFAETGDPAVIGGSCVVNRSSMLGYCEWFPNMHVRSKVPVWVQIRMPV